MPSSPPMPLYFEDPYSALEGFEDASRTLFLGDLSYFCNEEDLCALFSPYGAIMTVRVRRGVTGESLMHGFIAMSTPEAARWAIAEVDGLEFMGRNIRVQLSSDQHRSPSKERFVQLHVSFITRNPCGVITEKTLRAFFQGFGAIADVAIKKHTTAHRRQSGYGFVYFVNPQAACAALQGMKHHTIGDVTFDCSISHKSEHLLRRPAPGVQQQHHTPLPPHPYAAYPPAQYNHFPAQSNNPYRTNQYYPAQVPAHMPSPSMRHILPGLLGGSNSACGQLPDPFWMNGRSSVARDDYGDGTPPTTAFYPRGAGSGSSSNLTSGLTSRASEGSKGSPASSSFDLSLLTASLPAAEDCDASVTTLLASWQ